MGAANSQVDAATWQMPLMSGAVCGIAAAQTISAFPASSKIILFELGLPTAIGKRVQRGQPGTLMILDLDGFKPVNWLGKPVGAVEAETLSRAEVMQGPTLRLAG